LKDETYLYACKIKETTNGRWRRSRSQARSTFQVLVERCIARDVQIDEQKGAAQNGQDQAQRKADKAEAALRIAEASGVERGRSALLHYLHHFFERFGAHFTRPYKGMVEDIYQK
jgi:hypothetical protein